MQRTISATGLQTSGKELRLMLEKSGARHKLEGAEKLDFLVWLADQVKGSIEEGRRMQLKCSELNDFLQRERIAPAGGILLDAKGAVSGLLELRRREISRLRYDADRVQHVESGDAHFMLALANMPAERVDRCFEDAIVLYQASAVSESLPGSVASPRQEAVSLHPKANAGSLRQSAQACRSTSQKDSLSAPQVDKPNVTRGSSQQRTMPPGVPPPPRMAPPPSVRPVNWSGTSPPGPVTSEPPPAPGKRRCAIM